MARGDTWVTVDKRLGSLRLCKPLKIGTWNVRTLNTSGAARQELTKTNISIMGLHEVCWHGIGEIKVGDYSIIWSGTMEGDTRQGGVALD